MEVPEEAGCCGFGREAAIADVGQAVAVGVGAVGVRMPGEIGSEAVGRGEAGTFADEDEAEAGSEMETDGVADGDPALLYQSKRGDGPACDEELREKMCEQGDGVALDGQSREAIGDDDGEISGGELKLGNGVRVEGPAKSRLAEIGGTVGGVGLELEDRNGGFGEDGEFVIEALREGGKVKQSVYGVARLSVGELEIEHSSRSNAMAGSRQGDSGRSEVA
jgi:hypothetical protein